jgi:hypothetical protein
MTQNIEALVIRGQRKAGAELIGPRQAHFERVLGSPIYPKSLNLWIDRVYEGLFGRWPWKVCAERFDENARREPCEVNGVAGFIVYAENPSTCWLENVDGERYDGGLRQDKTMLEVLCAEKIQGVDYDVMVRLEADLDAL